MVRKIENEGITHEEQGRPKKDERPSVLVVNRDQEVDQVVCQVRQENLLGENNLATIVERIMAQNGVNMGLQRPKYTSPMLEYVLKTELPRGWKVPKFTKFTGETNESTVEHIARYLAEAEDIANNENFRMRYFPSSLTKNSFTWLHE